MKERKKTVCLTAPRYQHSTAETGAARQTAGGGTSEACRPAVGCSTGAAGQLLSFLFLPPFIFLFFLVRSQKSLGYIPCVIGSLLTI